MVSAYYSDEDCDDSIASVYPGANEICDGLDNDCDGEVDEEVRNTYMSMQIKMVLVHSHHL